jgi:hypothetical protein
MADQMVAGGQGDALNGMEKMIRWDEVVGLKKSLTPSCGFAVLPLATSLASRSRSFIMR